MHVPGYIHTLSFWKGFAIGVVLGAAGYGSYNKLVIPNRTLAEDICGSGKTMEVTVGLEGTKARCIDEQVPEQQDTLDTPGKKTR